MNTNHMPFTSDVSVAPAFVVEIINLLSYTSNVLQQASYCMNPALLPPPYQSINSKTDWII